MEDYMYDAPLRPKYCSVPGPNGPVWNPALGKETLVISIDPRLGGGAMATVGCPTEGTDLWRHVM
jgi:hypothetical protein